MNRTVTASSGNTLTLNSSVTCKGNSCAGWGAWLDSNLNTLDQDGEWYYDANASKVYVYSTSGSPGAATMEGSVVVKPNPTLQEDPNYLGAVIIGDKLATAR